MAAITYKTVINSAIQGFTDIQGALANFTDLSLAAVSTKDNGDKTGNKTPAQMVDYIGKLASIKNGTNFVTGKIAYNSANATQNGLINSSTGVVSYSYTIPVGYYPGTTKVSGTVNLGISTGTIVDGDITEPSAAASISQGDGTLAKLVDDGTTNVNSGISLESPATSQILGTDYWTIIPTISSSNGSVKAAVARATYGFTPENNSYATGAARTLTPSTSTGQTFYINKATLSVAQASQITVNKTTNTSTLNSTLLGSAVTEQPSSGYFIGIEGTGSTGSVKGSKGGYLPLNTSQALTPTSQTVYFPITQAAYSSTAGTIELSANSADGTLNGTNIYNSVGASSLSEPTSGYYIYINGTGTAGSSKVSTAGYTPLNKTTSVSVTNKAKYFPINSGSVNVNFNTLSIGSSDVSLSNGVTGTHVINTGTGISSSLSTSTDNFYIPVNSTSTSASITATASASAAGYIGSSYSANSTQVVTASGSNTRYISIPAGAYSSTVSYSAPNITVANVETGFTKSSTATAHYVSTTGTNSKNATALATATIGTTGYITTGTKSSSQASFAPVINGGTSYSEVVYIPDGVAHNGYITTAGFMTKDTSMYTLAYDSTNECLNFVWNN